MRPTALSHHRAGLVLAVAIGLGATAHGVFSPRIIAHYADSPDSVDITRWAERAGPHKLLDWFTGPWIQESSPYYRPLSSIAFWLQYLAFGWNFQGHVVISWLAHGIICGLVFMLGVRLLGGGGAVWLAVAAVALLNLRLGPTGPGWMAAPVAYGVVAWWPGQTDQFSLLFSLAALLALDGWLQDTRKGGLWQAAVLWTVALLFKEMAVSLPLVAGALVICRKGFAAARLRPREGDGAPAGLLWKTVLPGLAIVAAFLALRSVFVPEAWGPQARSVGYFVEKFTWYVAERPRALVIARGAWLVVMAAFLAVCLCVYARLPRRPSVVWLALGMVIGAGLIAELAGGNFALITIPGELSAIGVVTLMALGIIVLLHARAGPVWPLLAMTLAVHLPILHVQGPHYMYWPAAFWGLFNASLLQEVHRRLKRGREGGPPGTAGAGRGRFEASGGELPADTDNPAP